MPYLHYFSGNIGIHGGNFVINAYFLTQELMFPLKSISGASDHIASKSSHTQYDTDIKCSPGAWRSLKLSSR